MTDKVLPWAQKAIVPLTNGIWSGIRGAVGFAFDLIVGIIVSIYLMGMKERAWLAAARRSTPRCRRKMPTRSCAACGG